MKSEKGKMKRALLSLLILISLASCQKELKPASVIIVDPVRHYYPVLQGQNLSVIYEIENTSANPLFIQEVQTTCGCLISRDDLPIIILPHKKGSVHLDFNTLKNTGYVCHYIYCYGNFQDSAYVEMSFDTNVVPRADYIRDYEQLWYENLEANGLLHDYVDGRAADKGYYIDSQTNPREQRSEEIQKEIDRHAF